MWPFLECGQQDYWANEGERGELEWSEAQCKACVGHGEVLAGQYLGRREDLGNPKFTNEPSGLGVLCPEQGYWPVARPRSVGGLFGTFGRHLRGACSQTLRRRVVQRHIQEGLRLGARASGAFRETVRLRTSAWRSGVGERQVIRGRSWCFSARCIQKIGRLEFDSAGREIDPDRR